MEESYLLLENVPKQIDTETIELIFENQKYIGKCEIDYTIEKIIERSSQQGVDDVRDVIIKYHSPKCIYQKAANNRLAINQAS